MIIYKITNIINGKIYIGCTTRTIKDRFRSHFGQRLSGGCIAIARAIVKYGLSNFKIEEIQKCSTKKEMFEREEYWIGILDSMNSNIGYNLTKGGDRGPIKFGKDNPNFGTKNIRFTELNKSRTGIKLSEDHKRKMSISLIGRKAKDVTNMSNARKKAWANGIYKNIGKAISLAKMGTISPRRVAIICLNNNKVYDSYTEAAIKLSLSTGNITNVVNEKYLHTKGYKFQKLTEEHLIF